MNPKEFTDYVVPKLRAALPKSRLYQVENHADAAYLEIPSRRGKLHLLVSTLGGELTIGFSAGPGKFSWHSHLDGNEPLDEKILTAAETINEILQDRKGVICSSVLGPFPGDQEDLERVAKYRQETETIELKYWSSF
jgi:hypothetical protein